MRNPNGYGTVYKLSGKRRKPYCVRKVVSYDEQGKATYEYLGYFEKRADANSFLAQYNMTPHERAQNFTFKDVYEMWSKKHSKEIKSFARYETAFERSKCLHEKLLQQVTQADLQGIIDDYTTDGAKVYLKNMYTMMWEYAESREIISKEQNRTRYLEVPAQAKSTMHKRFTNDELNTLWEHKDDVNVQTILTLIYSGCRPSEVFNLKPYNLHDDYFEVERGKTKNAARQVPIYEGIRTYLFQVTMMDITTPAAYANWVNNSFNVAMKQYGMEHTPYDCRHTFASLWADNELNEMYRRFIQGHSLNGIGEQVYTHIGMDKLYKEINRLPKSFCSNTHVLHTKIS